MDVKHRVYFTMLLGIPNSVSRELCYYLQSCSIDGLTRNHTMKAVNLEVLSDERPTRTTVPFAFAVGLSKHAIPAEVMLQKKKKKTQPLQWEILKRFFRSHVQ